VDVDNGDSGRCVELPPEEEAGVSEGIRKGSSRSMRASTDPAIPQLPTAKIQVAS